MLARRQNEWFKILVHLQEHDVHMVVRSLQQHLPLESDHLHHTWDRPRPERLSVSHTATRTGKQDSACVVISVKVSGLATAVRRATYVRTARAKVSPRAWARVGGGGVVGRGREVAGAGAVASWVGGGNASDGWRQDGLRQQPR